MISFTPNDVTVPSVQLPSVAFPAAFDTGVAPVRVPPPRPRRRPHPRHLRWPSRLRQQPKRHRLLLPLLHRLTRPQRRPLRRRRPPQTSRRPWPSCRRPHRLRRRRHSRPRPQPRPRRPMRRVRRLLRRPRARRPPGLSLRRPPPLPPLPRLLRRPRARRQASRRRKSRPCRPFRLRSQCRSTHTRSRPAASRKSSKETTTERSLIFVRRWLSSRTLHGGRAFEICLSSWVRRDSGRSCVRRHPPRQRRAAGTR